MEAIKEFKKDCWVCFDRTEVNIKGYKYTIDQEEKLVHIHPKSYEQLKKEIGDYLWENWVFDGESNVSLNQWDLEYSEENPFQDYYLDEDDNKYSKTTNCLLWSEYYKDLDIPKDWENISYSNDELPSFQFKDYKIWINSPLLKERQENYLGIGFKNLDQFKDWIFTVCDYDPIDCECKDDIFQTMDFNEVLSFLKEVTQ